MIEIRCIKCSAKVLKEKKYMNIPNITHSKWPIEMLELPSEGCTYAVEIELGKENQRQCHIK